jgi:hypothetical protein
MNKALMDWGKTQKERKNTEELDKKLLEEYERRLKEMTDLELEQELRSARGRAQAARRVYNNSYYHRNKERLNAKRKAKRKTPRAIFKKCRRKASERKQAWTLTYEQWLAVWQACPKIFNDISGGYEFAWNMRGPDVNKNTQMRRIDTRKGWTPSNVTIMYRNQIVPEHGILSPWDWKTNRPEGEVT